MATKSDRFRSLDRRHRRVRKKVTGTPERPRLAVYRSNKHIYAQVIDDLAGRTLVASSTTTTSGDGAPKDKAKSVGLDVASKAKAAKSGKGAPPEATGTASADDSTTTREAPANAAKAKRGAPPRGAPPAP